MTTCANCGTEESKKWMKKDDKQFCSKMCVDAYSKKGAPSAACEFC
ncbi:MAG TPA: hypothetical protein VJH24_00945 [Candidatus Bilamarchaeaceae archaeon]|nr:hypothetical protein [Candidatus Bilamarchaeaceae archaeon]